MALKAVFFDLDGTLLDTSRDLGAALNRVRLEEKLPLLADDLIRQHVSNGANALIKLGFGEELTDDSHQGYRQRLLDHYLASIAEHTSPFPGIAELIEQLTARDIAWGIVTNKPLRYTNALMEHFHFASPPVATVSPEHVGISKPSPEPLLYACKLAGCAPQEALYVGDHERDVICARKAGMPSIAVGYGFTDTPEDYLGWSADHTAATVMDIWPIVQVYLTAEQFRDSPTSDELAK